MNIFKDLLQTHSKQGLYLKGLRLRENYTQVQLGKLLGITQANISSMEKGSRTGVRHSFLLRSYELRRTG